MTSRFRLITLATLVLISGAGWTFLQQSSTGPSMTEAARAYLASLDEQQRVKSLMEFETPQRLGWHFIPKVHRKGLQVKEMNQAQRTAALELMRKSLSEVGYGKATKIMALESVLHELERDGGGSNIRDPERYYFTVFGQPGPDQQWGLSMEGHHLSLNFVVDGDTVASSTPTFFAANPAIIKNEVQGIKIGTRVLAQEEQLAFDLVNSLSEEQLEVALIDDTAPREIRAAGEPQAPQEEAVGVSFEQLDGEQRRIMRELVQSYARNVPDDIAESRIREIRDAGPENVKFAWAGARKPGVGHYYRIQGPTFLIEFVNTQPDSAGNPANHIHCVWRDPRGDFAIPVGNN